MCLGLVIIDLAQLLRKVHPNMSDLSSDLVCYHNGGNDKFSTHTRMKRQKYWKCGDDGLGTMTS